MRAKSRVSTASSEPLGILHTADILPHEQVAFAAQTHSSERPQHVAGLVTMLKLLGCEN